MRKYIFLIIAIFISIGVGAQCLGDDCTISGRQKASKNRAAKMTKNKQVGRSYKKSGKKANSGGYDPFAKKNRKNNGHGGYDPFATKKKKRKSSGGYDSLAKKSRKKNQSGGYDSFANQSKKQNQSGGYDSFEGGSNKKSIAAGGIWFEGDNNKPSGRSRVRSRKPSGNTYASEGTASPSYERQYDFPRSYSDFEGSSFGSDYSFGRSSQYKVEFVMGEIFQHSDKVKNYLKEADLNYVMGVNFGVEWQTSGGKNWHHYFNMPTVGVGFTYLNLGNDNLLGHAVSAYPYIDLPLVRTKAFGLNFSNGFGLGYVSKYDKSSSSNPEMQTPLIGSPINAFLKSGLSINVRPVTSPSSQSGERWSRMTLHAGFSWMHLSNGSFSSPNSGINMLAASVGVKYNPNPMPFVHRQKAEKLPRFFTIDLMGTGGVREMHHLDSKKYFVGNFNTTLYYQVASIYRIGVGVDGFYDGGFGDTHDSSFQRYTKADGQLMYDPDNVGDSFRGGVCLSNEFVMGRTTAAFDGGLYFYDPIKQEDEKFYLRFALKYRFTNNLFGVGTLKTHKTVAEYVSLGIGYSFLL